jgi:DNA-binding transcriptional LysR family regulator
LAHHVQAVVRDSGTAHPRDEGWLGAAQRFTVSSLDASLATILAGLAYAWLPEHALTEPLRSGALRRLPLVSGASRIVPLHIVLVHANVLGPAARVAADAFHRHAKAQGNR